MWGDNQKTLYLNGVLNADSGNGGLAVKENSIVVLTNNNVHGGIWVEKGTVQLSAKHQCHGDWRHQRGGQRHAGFTIWRVTLRPVAINLYGTGTNANWEHSENDRWTSSCEEHYFRRGFADCRDSGGLTCMAGYRRVHTLYITNTVA